MLAIFKREVKAYFYSPIAYALIGFFTFMSGIFFFIVNVFGGDGDFLIGLNNLSLVLLIIVPILTMRIMAEDRKNNTEVLLMTSPTSLWRIVTGKFLSAFFVFFVMTVCSFIFPITIFIYGNPYIPGIIGGYAGFLFMGACFIVVGVLMSSLTENQVVAAILTFVSLLFIWVVNVLAVIVGGMPARILMWFSVISRFEAFYNGIFDIIPIVYYFSFIGVFLFITVRLIERRRWSE